jgi:hypothetical protein
MSDVSMVVVAVAAGANVGVAVYAWFTWGLWTEAKHQAEITRQMFEAQHRPYLSFRTDMLNLHATDLRLAAAARCFFGNCEGLSCCHRATTPHGPRTNQADRHPLRSSIQQRLRFAWVFQVILRIDEALRRLSQNGPSIATMPAS